jgi:carbonic anhydrase
MKRSARSFWSAGLAVTLLLALGCKGPQHGHSSAAIPTPARDIATGPPTKESQAAMIPQQALAELRTGNARFVAGHLLKRDLRADVKATASAQHPFAVVLSCLDSRQPTEIVLDQSIGDIFCARVAGNVLSEDVLGSMEFGCQIAGAKLVAIIGHSNCGAIKGAVDGVEMAHLTELLDKIKPAIEAVPAQVQPRTSNNHEFVDKVAEANVRLVMHQVRERSPVLREMLDQGRIGLVGGIYDLSTGEVRFFDQ